MSQYNVDLMLAVREQITSHPETHDQDAWARRTECGTTYCIAGWACVLSGEKLDWGGGWYGNQRTYFIEGPVDGSTAIPDVASQLLGLNKVEAFKLFYSTNGQALARLDELIEKGKNQP